MVVTILGRIHKRAKHHGVKTHMDEFVLTIYRGTAGIGLQDQDGIIVREEKLLYTNKRGLQKPNAS